MNKLLAERKWTENTFIFIWIEYLEMLGFFTKTCNYFKLQAIYLKIFLGLDLFLLAGWVASLKHSYLFPGDKIYY